jgi:ribA/ribD-fused uncharacterized protein
MLKTIKEFKGRYRWLSNFYDCEVILRGMKYPSVENAYQSAKSDSVVWKEGCKTISASVAKKEGRKVTLVPNWDIVRIRVMRNLLNQKFSQDFFKEKLIATGDAVIIEGNYWGDTFWGVDIDTMAGQNRLGIMIMSIRMALRVGGKLFYETKETR